MKILIFLILLTPLLFSSDLKTEQKIYNLIIHTLVPQKKDIKVWCDTDSKKRLLKAIDGITCISSVEDADFVLLSKPKKLPNKTIVFVTNIQLLTNYKNSVIGGFFWQKGRPNILFLRKNLDTHNIKLPKSMQEYIEDEI